MKRGSYLQNNHQYDPYIWGNSSPLEGGILFPLEPNWTQVATTSPSVDARGGQCVYSFNCLDLILRGQQGVLAWRYHGKLGSARGEAWRATSADHSMLHAPQRLVCLPRPEDASGCMFCKLTKTKTESGSVEGKKYVKRILLDDETETENKKNLKEQHVEHPDI